MDRLTRLACIAAVVGALGSCERTAGPEGEAPAKASKASTQGAYEAALAAQAAVPRDLSSPDRALKTIWAIQDANAAVQCAALERIKSDKQLGPVYADASGRGALDGMLAGATERYWADLERPCSRNTFARDIREVKVESETRAVVIARIRNTTPIPEGAEVDDYDREAREDGETYRYIFTKGEPGWQLEEVWSLDGVLGEREVYDPDQPPYVPTITMPL